jgi:hypothetical protein
VIKWKHQNATAEKGGMKEFFQRYGGYVRNAKRKIISKLRRQKVNVENKTEKKLVRFTRSEVKEINRVADKLGVRFSEFVRSAVRLAVSKYYAEQDGK